MTWGWGVGADAFIGPNPPEAGLIAASVRGTSNRDCRMPRQSRLRSNHKLCALRYRALGASRGSSTTKRLMPSWLSAQIFPPWAWTMAWAMERPRP